MHRWHVKTTEHLHGRPYIKRYGILVVLMIRIVLLARRGFHVAFSLRERKLWLDGFLGNTFHDGGSRLYPIFNYSLTFLLLLRKDTENLNLG